jgi:prepilin-type N-terminal cleavage/methylation domain-containing protein
MRNQRGMSLVEMLVVLGITGVVAGMAAPMVSNAVGFFRLSGDARGVSNGIAVAKMRAAANFSQTRFYADLSSNTFRIESWQKTGAPNWVTTVGTAPFATGDRFGFSVVGAPPPNTQAVIGQAPACRDKDGNVIGNTACVVFNSRGTPVDATGAPTGVDALYVTDGTSVYGVTVSATGMIRLWRTKPAATPSWVLQ